MHSQQVNILSFQQKYIRLHFAYWYSGCFGVALDYFPICSSNSFLAFSISNNCLGSDVMS